MAQTVKRSSYTFPLTIASLAFFDLDVNNLELKIERVDNPDWQAHVIYKIGQEPTVLTYEFTGIEITDTPGQFSIIDTGTNLRLMNNTLTDFDFLVTRIT